MSVPPKALSGRSLVARQTFSISAARTEEWPSAATPLQWTARPIAGATAIMTSGNANTTATTRATTLCAIGAIGEDRSITGNSVQADMDHSEVNRTPTAG